MNLLNAIDDYIEQEESEGKGVKYNEIIGTLEYVKLEIIDRSYDQVS